MMGNDDLRFQALLSEFQALRDEIVAKIKSQYQILAIVAGFLAVSVAYTKDIFVFLLFPLILYSFGFYFVYEIKMMRLAGTYIMNEIEKVLGLNWETWLRKHGYPTTQICGSFLLFVITPLICIIYFFTFTATSGGMSNFFKVIATIDIIIFLFFLKELLELLDCSTIKK